MQTKPTMPPKKPSVKSSFRKWLPALALAIGLHIVVIAFFLNNTSNKRENTKEELSLKETSSSLSNETQGTNGSQEDPVIENDTNLTEDAQLKTITASSVDKEDVAGQSNEDTLPKTSNKEDTNKNVQSQADNASNSKDLDEKSSNAVNSEKNTVNKEEGINSNVQQQNKISGDQKIAEQSQTAQSTLRTEQQNIALNTPSTLNQNATLNRGNPNQRLLLSRDLPSNEQIVNGASDLDEEYRTTASEVEAINEKLSETINAVKERKLKEIEAQQQQAHQAYINDKQTNIQVTQPRTVNASEDNESIKTNSSDAEIPTQPIN